ncbi:hypothetical protein DSO57_1030776 [Entomophthora muscae]|uniref:Uncharacterized protein n=1 Tax=Entomophthora muscae TaxID=34485 RepID=A0ACC2UL96_9FUNG|nr:hypothetical protein DSO57_1030776 [Entomophthora muscae]
MKPYFLGSQRVRPPSCQSGKPFLSKLIQQGKGCTIKYAWNRTTPRSLYQAVFSALPVNRR